MKKLKKYRQLKQAGGFCVIVAQLLPLKKLAFLDLSCRKIRH